MDSSIKAIHSYIMEKSSSILYIGIISGVVSGTYIGIKIKDYLLDKPKKEPLELFKPRIKERKSAKYFLHRFI